MLSDMQMLSHLILTRMLTQIFILVFHIRKLRLRLPKLKVLDKLQDLSRGQETENLD